MLAAGDGLFDESHPFDSIVDGGEDRGCTRSVTFGVGDHGIVGGGVNVGEGFEEGFGVSAWESAGFLRGLMKIRSIGVAGIDLVGLAIASNDHGVGVFLAPDEGAEGSIDFDRQVIFAAVANLAGGHGAHGAVLEADDGGPVVIELTTGFEGFEDAADVGRFQLGHIASEIVSMGRDIAKATGCAALGGIGSPSGLFLIAVFEAGTEPALNVLSAEGLDFAEFPFGDHFAGLSYERIAGVVVGQGEDESFFGNNFLELFGLGEVKGHRFIADDVEAGFESGLGDFEVSVIGSGDRNEVDPFVGGELGFRGQHFLVGTVGTGGLNVVIGGGGFGAFRIAAESTGDEGGSIVQARGDGVDFSDEGTLSATDETHSQFTFQRTIDRHEEQTPKIWWVKEIVRGVDAAIWGLFSVGAAAICDPKPACFYHILGKLSFGDCDFR